MNVIFDFFCCVTNDTKNDWLGTGMSFCVFWMLGADHQKYIVWFTLHFFLVENLHQY